MERKRREQALAILVRPVVCRVEQERLALLGARFEELVVYSMMDDTESLRIELEPLDRIVANVLAGHDHKPRVMQ